MEKISTNILSSHVVSRTVNGNTKSYADLEGREAINDTIDQLEISTSRVRKTDFSLTDLKAAVADGNLEKYGLKVGDQKTINGYTYVIAGLNPMKGTHGYRVNKNHVGLIVIPHTTCAWNASGSTSTGADDRGAGYKNSDLHYYLKNTTLPHVQNDLGSDNLIAHAKLLSNAVDTNAVNKSGGVYAGASSGWAWEENCYISALSEVQVYGAAICSSSFFDTGEACRQLDVFQNYSHTEIFGNEYIWLRDIVSASLAAFAAHAGYANCDTAQCTTYVAALVLYN